MWRLQRKSGVIQKDGVVFVFFVHNKQQGSLSNMGDAKRGVDQKMTVDTSRLVFVNYVTRELFQATEDNRLEMAAKFM